MKKIYLIGYSSKKEDNKEKFSRLLEIDELKDLERLYIGDSSNDIEVSNYITNKTILKVDTRVGDKNLSYSNYPSNKDEVLSNLATLSEMDYRFTHFLNDTLSEDIKKVGVVLNNIIVLSFLENMFEFNREGSTFRVTFLNKELLNGEVPNPIIYELIYSDFGKFEDINRIAL